MIKALATRPAQGAGSTVYAGFAATGFRAPMNRSQKPGTSRLVPTFELKAAPGWKSVTVMPDVKRPVTSTSTRAS